jgi:N-methylhydantoinase A
MFGIHTIGAGGGSIARVDAGGTLRVGPESAGAVPGPACYGRGGTEPTVTDANLVLGYLNPTASFGGTVTLDPNAARQAIEARVAEPMGLSVEAAAHGILRMINAHMSNGIRVVSVQQGYDPRDFALVAFGGNGAVHAGRQAEDLGISTVLVPRMAGAFSAYGGLQADAQVDHLTTWIGDCESADLSALDDVISRLLDRARSALGSRELTHEASLACHYAGQTSEIWVPLELVHDRVTPEAIASAAESFHQEHERERSFAKRDEKVMIAGAKVSSRCAAHPLPNPRKVHSPPDPRSAAQPTSQRRVYFDADAGWLETNVYTGWAVSAGDCMKGPAIIEEPDTTVVVYPSWKCLLEATNVYRLTRNGDAS